MWKQKKTKQNRKKWTGYNYGFICSAFAELLEALGDVSCQQLYLKTLKLDKKFCEQTNF